MEAAIRKKYRDSLRDVVELHFGQIADRILQPDMKEIICNLSDTFPQDIARDFIFESKLYSSEKTADFPIRLAHGCGRRNAADVFLHGHRS